MNVVAPLVTSHTAAEMVQADLRKQIIEGHLVSGDRLIDTALAESYGVSRNTVRDALRLLAADGLVVSVRNAGSSVRRLDVDDVRDIYTTRRLLESAVVLNSARATDEQLANVDQAADTTQRYITWRDWKAAGTSSLAFHQALVRLAGSDRLNTFFDNMVAQLRLAFAFMPDESRFQRQWAAKDREIADKILSGRREEANALLMTYLDQSEAMVIDAIRFASRTKH